MLGHAPDRLVTFSTGPRGAERGTCRAHVGTRTVYATRRRDPAVTAREAEILEALHAEGAPVPRVIAFEEGWLLQASAGPQRLSESLNHAATEPSRRLLVTAVESLADLHRAGEDRHLEARVPTFACGERTAGRLLEHLEAVGERCHVPLPSVDKARLLDLMGRPGDAFVKWDARPANAAVDAQGMLRWFDWQHANRRHRSDDLVWLLCDESIPDACDAPSLLFESAATWREDPDRVAAMAVAHVGTRLRGCFTGAAGLDTSWKACLESDWLGSRETVRRLCHRGAGVAPHSRLTEPLGEWFERLARTAQP